MSMTDLRVIAMAIRVNRAVETIIDLTTEDLEAAARFQLDARNNTCRCGQVHDTPEDRRALETSAAYLLAAAEFISAAKASRDAASIALLLLEQRHNKS